MRSTRSAVTTVLVTAVALVLGLASPSFAARPGSATYPSSMASTGDSITRAFDVSGSCFLVDCPQYSWSTGSNSTVNSHLLRLKKLNRKFGSAWNNARSGAKMADLAGQLQATAAQNVGYVTILMGANDLCTSSAATMTPTATFRSQFESALSAYVAARPSSKVYVSSIPNIYQLWSVLRTNLSAQATWGLFGICQSMLSSSNTEADRQLVVQREAELNAALRDVCALHTQCRWDGYAGFNTAFTAADVSTVDYFHPSLAGQNKLASVTWTASYWG